jgi:Tol biopolymer transport system component
MRAKPILIFLALAVLSVHAASLFGQRSLVTTVPAQEQTTSLISNVPKRIAFISDIGGGESLYVTEPDHSDVNPFGKLHLDNVRIPGPYNLVFSPDRKQVMFVGHSTTHKDQALWMMNSDGSGARKLMDWKWGVHSPFEASWSPAGDQIAIVIEMQNLHGIYLMNVDGSNFHFVAYGDQFSWSPDGQQLAITGYVPKQQGRYLQLVNIDGSNLRLISTSSRASDCAWSPDGKLLAFSEYRAETTPESRFNVFVIQPDGREQKTILENVPLYSGLTWSPHGEFLSFITDFEGNRGLYAWSPQRLSQKGLRFFTGVEGPFDWSPDGKHIAYGEDGVRLVDVETSKTKILFHTSGFGRPLWLKDGNSLLLTSWPRRWTIDSQDLDVYTTKLEPQFITRLTEEGLHVYDVSCPPTGKLIAFAALPTPKSALSNSIVYAVNPDGRNRRRLPVAKIEPGWFAWSADGTKIAFVKEKSNCSGCSSGNLEIHMANADGSGERVLVKDPSWNFAPAWLPDGKSIVFLSDRANTHGIYAADVKSKRTRLVLELSLSITDHFRVGNSDKFVPLLWSPDTTKLAIGSRSSIASSQSSISVIDLKKPSAVFRFSGIAPYMLSWTPDSQRIVIVDLVHGLVMNSITPSYVDLLAVDGSGRVKLIPAHTQVAPQLFRIVWRLDGERFASSGISIFNGDGSNQRWIVSGFRPAWVR